MSSSSFHLHVYDLNLYIDHFLTKNSYENLSLDCETFGCQKYQIVLMDDRKQYISVHRMIFQGATV